MNVNRGPTALHLFLAGMTFLGATGEICAQVSSEVVAAVEEAAPWKAAQKEVVARLTGHGALESGIIARSTPDERAAAADFLTEALRRIGLTPRRHDYRHRNTNGLVDLLLSPYRGTNVYAVVEATRPGAEVVVVGAHYDSEPGCPGAGDNASGVALVHALADRLSKLENRRLSFLLAFFDQEEDDEVGSRAFARFLRKEGYAVHSVHITDLSGWDEGGDGVITLQSPGPYLEERYRKAAERLGLTLQVIDGAASDNASFLAAGYRCAGVFGDVTEHLHKPSDTYETVDFDFLASMTDLVFEVVTELDAEGAGDAR